MKNKGQAKIGSGEPFNGEEQMNQLYLEYYFEFNYKP